MGTAGEEEELLVKEGGHLWRRMDFINFVALTFNDIRGLDQMGTGKYNNFEEFTKFEQDAESE